MRPIALSVSLSLVATSLVSLIACGGATPSATSNPTPIAPTATTEPLASASTSATTVPEHVATGADVPNDNDHPQKAECQLKTRDIPGKEGGTRFMLCPAGCAKTGGTVWGTDVYTDDSAVCGAAIHAGAITDAGGKVVLTFVPGGKMYVGTERNGVTTSDWGSWGRSFYAQTVDASGKPTSKVPTPMDLTKPQIGCSTTADTVKSVGAARVVCPAGCKSGSGYGSGPYTSDSSVCAMARHQGLLKDGGEIGITHVASAKAFKGTNKNGVTTSDWLPDHAAFTLAK